MTVNFSNIHQAILALNFVLREPDGSGKSSIERETLEAWASRCGDKIANQMGDSFEQIEEILTSSAGRTEVESYKVWHHVVDMLTLTRGIPNN